MRDRSSLVLLVALVLVFGAAVGFAGFRFGGADESISLEAEPVYIAAPAPTATQLPAPNAIPKPAAPTTHGLALVGALRLDPFNRELHADVAAYKNLAFVGSRCMSGVHIVDISNPAAPVRLASTASYPNTAMEDIKVMRIGGRDVLAIGLQDCGSNPGLGPGKLGLELVDISEPARPRTLSIYAIQAGVHEFDLTETPGGRVLALLAVPGYEAGPTAGAQGIAGLQIVDISDPERPALLATWSVLKEPSLGPAFFQQERRGSSPRVLLHSARANKDGTRAYLSYWDAGVIILDISDPARPTMLGRTAFAPGEEGNAHSVAETPDGALLVEADEDFSPYQLAFTSTAFKDSRPAYRIPSTPAVADVAGRMLVGTVVRVGRACPGGTPLPSLAGKIALIERGGCDFGLKVAQAQLAQAIGAVIYDSGDTSVPKDFESNSSVTLPDGATVELAIPGLFVDQETGQLLASGPAPVTVRAVVEQDGRGGLRLFDISDPAHPVQLSRFATEDTNKEEPTGMWSAHNPEIKGDMLFVSWYSDGVRALDISRPAAPREIGYWTGADAPPGAPPVNIWGVLPYGDLILASDMDYGLYILKIDR